MIALCSFTAVTLKKNLVFYKKIKIMTWKSSLISLTYTGIKRNIATQQMFNTVSTNINPNHNSQHEETVPLFNIPKMLNHSSADLSNKPKNKVTRTIESCFHTVFSAQKRRRTAADALLSCADLSSVAWLPSWSFIHLFISLFICFFGQSNRL